MADDEDLNQGNNQNQNQQKGDKRPIAEQVASAIFQEEKKKAQADAKQLILELIAMRKAEKALVCRIIALTAKFDPPEKTAKFLEDL